MYVLVRSEIVGLYLNPLSAGASYYPYYRFNTANLPQPIQMYLS